MQPCLSPRQTCRHKLDESDVKSLQLFPTNNLVDKINEDALSKLEERATVRLFPRSVCVRARERERERERESKRWRDRGRDNTVLPPGEGASEGGGGGVERERTRKRERERARAIEAETALPD